MGFFKRLTRGLTRSRGALGDRLTEATANRKITPELIEEVEEILITADLGMAVTSRLMQTINDEIRYNKMADAARLWEVLRIHLGKALAVAGSRSLQLKHVPTVVLMVGVNGVGKTTSIGKLATRYTAEGKKVVLAAGDTFRAAASEQLVLWGERTGVDVISHKAGADAASVTFDACEAAIARKADLLLIDTAGRLHTNNNLMAELEKVQRVITKVIPDAPHEVILVLDANTGQNAMGQARAFTASVGVTGLILTKMDSTAKGGILINLANTLEIPIYFIGVGESAEDLQPFDGEAFLEALLGPAGNPN